MRKEYTKPELNISEYVIDTNITAEAVSGGLAIGNPNDAQANWGDIWKDVA